MYKNKYNEVHYYGVFRPFRKKLCRNCWQTIKHRVILWIHSSNRKKKAFSESGCFEWMTCASSTMNKSASYLKAKRKRIHSNICSYRRTWSERLKISFIREMKTLSWGTLQSHETISSLTRMRGNRVTIKDRIFWVIECLLQQSNVRFEGSVWHCFVVRMKAVTYKNGRSGEGSTTTIRRNNEYKGREALWVNIVLQ